MTSAIEEFVATVREISRGAGNGQTIALFDVVSKAQTGLTRTQPAHLDAALETMDVQEHTIGVLAIILAKYQQLEVAGEESRRFQTVSGEDLTRLLAQTHTFVLACHPEQIRLGSDLFVELLAVMCELLVERSEAVRGITIVIAGIEKLRAQPSQLTPLHTNLCHLCLSARNFRPALPFLDTDITELPKQSRQFDAKVFLLYYYYGGMIYTALKNFTRAAFFFDVAITVPASAVSMIMVEAYKKNILVNLIIHGKKPTLSKFTSPVVNQYLKPQAAAYHDLAASFETFAYNTVQAKVDKNRTTYEQDHNMGLVKQCVQAFFKRNIQKLTKTFMTLSLTDVAQKVQLVNEPEAERFVRSMIEDEMIYATINKKDAMVEFHDCPEKYNNLDVLDFLQKQEKECMRVNNMLRGMDDDISVNRDYIGKMCSYTDDASKAGSSSSYNA